MNYFTKEFTGFFKDLSKNNETGWFNENRKRYEKEVKKPFSEFVSELIRRISSDDPSVKISASDAIMRINKDIRFSKDKTPYNTYVAANISAHGKKDKSWPGIYIQIGADKIHIYGGAYMLETPVLQKVRHYISKHPDAFRKAYQDKNFTAKFGSIEGEKSKRIPPEFSETVKKEPLIANKQFYYQAELKPDTITDPRLADKIMEYYHAGKPLNEFLRKAISS